MTTLSTIELHKQSMDFSVAHFTIFSATERENLHGHNYSVHATLTAEIMDKGLSFDYRFYKQKIKTICDSLTGYTLLPTRSKFLRIEEEGNYYTAYFSTEKLFFLKRDVILLPLTNITVEELSAWFVRRLTEDPVELANHHIQTFTVKISNSPGQSGATTWTQPLTA